MDNGLFRPNHTPCNHGWSFCSRPQTFTRNSPAFFSLIVMSLCEMQGNCGCLSWLHSEPCFLSPIGLGGNWYIFASTTKKLNLIQTMVQHSKITPSTKLPATMVLLPYRIYLDLLVVPRQWKLTTTPR